MRTSLNEIKEIDDYLFQHMPAEDSLLFEAKLLLDPGLHHNVLWQKRAHQAIQLYSRNKLKAEIEEVHTKLFHTERHAGFREKILGIFYKK